MFENNHPYFDMKIGHNSFYFNTMNSLIPGLKYSNWCYVTEHMLFKTVLMKNLLDAIEMNYKLPGKFFWEKILMAIDLKDNLSEEFIKWLSQDYNALTFEKYHDFNETYLEIIKKKRFKNSK